MCSSDLIFVIVFLLTVIAGGGIYAWYYIVPELTARTISIFKTEGVQVIMTKGDAKQFAALEGLRLFNGYTVATGGKSYCSLRMDKDSLVKMNEISEIEVQELARNKLSVSLLSGAIAVNAAQQKPDNAMEIRAGNSAIAIRGTIFTAAYIKTSDVESMFIVAMLEGEVEVDGIFLKAGQTMYVYDDGISITHEIIDASIDESLSLFTLETIWEYQEEILAAGTYAEDEIEMVPGLIEDKMNPQEETVQAAPPSEATLDAAYRAYYDVLKAAVDEHGVSLRYEDTYGKDYHDNDPNEGISYAELIDFDNDGIPELLYTVSFGSVFIGK